MALFPIFANLSDCNVLVVGGGDVAQRKIEALLKAGAQIEIHAKGLNPALTEWLAQGRLQRLQGEFDGSWIDRVWLVVAATDDRVFNTQLAAEARIRKRLINVVDDAELSTFHVPAIVDRDPLQIAISSGGSSPMLARRLRERFESELDESFGLLASLIASNREAIRRQLPDLNLRRRWFDKILDGPIAQWLQEGQLDRATQMFSESLAHGATHLDAKGQIIIIDVRHGDPGLLTLKALRAMNTADLIVCGAGVEHSILEKARRDVDRIDAPDDDAKLAKLLIESAQAGMRVVLLAITEPAQKTQFAVIRSECDRYGIACQLPSSSIEH